MKFHPGFLSAHRESLYNKIVAAGLTTNLQICLDFTVLDTYNGGQTITDLSNNGDHFWKGSDATTFLDPTFNGSVGGATSAEYFTCSFAQLITQKTKGTWANAIHKDNATVTIMAVIKLDSSSNVRQIVTNDVGRATGPGFMFGVGLGNLKWEVAADASPYALQSNSTTLTVATGWNIIMISYNEAGSSHFRLNGNTQTFTAAYSSPSTNAALKEIIIGDSDAAGQFGIAQMAIWSRNLSTTETGTLYTAIKDKWSL